MPRNSPIGRGNGFKTRPVWVRVSPRAPYFRLSLPAIPEPGSAAKSAGHLSSSTEPFPAAARSFTQPPSDAQHATAGPFPFVRDVVNPTRVSIEIEAVTNDERTDTVPQHRLNAPASIPVTTLLLSDASSSALGPDSTASARTPTASVTTVAGATMALAGTIGLAAGGAAQAAELPSNPTGSGANPAPPTLQSLASLPGVADLDRVDRQDPEGPPAPVDKALKDRPTGRQGPARPAAPETAGSRQSLPTPGDHPPNPGKHTAVKPVHGVVTSGYGARWGVVLQRRHRQRDRHSDLRRRHRRHRPRIGSRIRLRPVGSVGRTTAPPASSAMSTEFQTAGRVKAKVDHSRQPRTIPARTCTTRFWDTNGNKINPRYGSKTEASASADPTRRRTPGRWPTLLALSQSYPGCRSRDG